MVSSFLGFFVLIVATSISFSEGLIHFSRVAVADRSSLRRVRAPFCTVEDDVANCCVTIPFPKETKICGKFIVSKNELKVKAALAVNDRQLVEKELSVGNLCYPVGPIVACVDIYFVAINLEQKKIETCFKASINNLGKELTSKNFNCIHFKNGKFSKTSQRPSQ